MKIAVIATSSDQTAEAKKLADALSIPYLPQETESYPLLLAITPKRIELRSTTKPKTNPIYVDFLSGKLAHRHQYGGGRGQLIARAVGLKSNKCPSVLDLTAGLGQDAFVLATLGCSVTMIERSKIIATLLNDGLERGNQEAWFAKLQLNLIQADSINYLSQLTQEPRPEVIYLDPMFPDSSKSALVKKEMRILRQIVGDDPDAKDLLNLARQTATERTVVKRARLAPTLADSTPDIVYTGKSSRFDVYLTTEQKI